MNRHTKLKLDVKQMLILIDQRDHQKQRDVNEEQVAQNHANVVYD